MLAGRTPVLMYGNEGAKPESGRRADDCRIGCPAPVRRRRCIYGAPDLVIEILSPSTRRKDVTIKLNKYIAAGVREYWIVNPMTRIVQVYCFGEPEDSTQYSFDEEISVGIYNDLKICIADLLK